MLNCTSNDLCDCDGDETALHVFSAISDNWKTTCLKIMMSSWHIRATEIKHASPPSAGCLLSLGLKTMVTHERSSQTKTCTLCKSQRDSAYSKHTHTGVECDVFRVLCFVLFFLSACTGCLFLNCLRSLTHACLFRIVLSACDVLSTCYVCPQVCSCHF